MCFAEGTLVTLTQAPRSSELEQSVWSSILDNDISPWEMDSLRFDSFDSNTTSATALAVEAKSRAEVRSGRYLQLPINEVPIGARVPTKNLRRWEYDNTFPEPNEVTWAQISITIHRDDGGIVDAESSDLKVGFVLKASKRGS